MKSLNVYLAEYQESHRHPLNITIHNICVPAIFWSVFGFLHTAVITNGVTLGHVAAIIALLFYSVFRNIKLIVIMTVILLVIFFSFMFVPQLRWVSVIVFVIGWLGQFYGHKVEGKQPSFFKDILFLFIGPIWVLKKLFRDN